MPHITTEKESEEVLLWIKQCAKRILEDLQDYILSLSKKDSITT